MDATVNDFLNEINEISPLNAPSPKNVWEKCYDEDSGYHYFWNVKTDEVTWNTPAEYDESSSKTRKKGDLYAPPRTAPLFPSSKNLVPVSDRIYKIGEQIDDGAAKEGTSQVPDVKPNRFRFLHRTVNRAVFRPIALVAPDHEVGAEMENNEMHKVNGENAACLAPDSGKTIEIEPPGISLVAGYGESDDEDKESIPEAVSTLFPNPKPIEIKDFEERPPEPDFNSKAFQRKRRIGVSLIGGHKKPKADVNEPGSEAQKESVKNGGVTFVKAMDEMKETKEIPGDIEDVYCTVKEKLCFLSEGRKAVSPVQVLLIQIETLYTAVKSGDLNYRYLRKWLEETCSDLVKLEKETTPEGWLLDWDRAHKRYYYRNPTTGASQWEYPECDITGCDEAMDICTTPPPNGIEPAIHLSPPLPPRIQSVSPPPAPIISTSKISAESQEPPPPGVDGGLDERVKSDASNLNDALSSFYSDIAAIEKSTVDEPNSEGAPNAESSDNVTDLKRKKKSKVKLAQGIAMKKKGVSKLVEKWKNVQMTLND